MRTAESCNSGQPNVPAIPRFLCIISPVFQSVCAKPCQIVQVRDCGSLLTVGGFNIPAVDVDDITIHYKDFKGVVNHIR